MANTFKVVTKAGITTQDTIYTVAASTTTVIIGITLSNTTTSQTTATVELVSDTANRAGDGTEANQTVKLVKDAPLPVGSAGNKVIMEATDELKLTGSGATDITLSIMEIT